MFGITKKHDMSMVNGDHPEIDDSLVISSGDILYKKYQMLVVLLNSRIGALACASTAGHLLCYLLSHLICAVSL